MIRPIVSRKRRDAGEVQSEKIEPVLIVGGGPVGLALAGDLGWRGISCVLIEQSDGSIYQPRMDLVGVRTMEFCRRWGLVPAVEGSPYPRDYAQDNVYLTSLTGYELGRERFPGIGQAPPPKESPQRRERCPQNMFDPILRAFAASQPSVTMRYRTRLVSFEQNAELVTAVVENAETGAREEIKARYIVGCDGARSPVRETLGIRMSGNPVLTYTTNVIFRCPHLLSLHDKGKAYRHIFIGPEGTWATIVAINGRDEWRFSLIGGAEQREYTTEEIKAAIRRAVGCEFEFEILERAAVGTARTGRRTLPQRPRLYCRRRRARDVADRRLRHEHRDRRRRRSVVEACRHDRRLGRRRPTRIPTASNASRSAPAMSPRRAAICAGCSSVGRHDDLLDPDAARRSDTRQRVGREFSEIMRREWHTLGVHLGYRYEGSPICWPDGSPAPPDDPRTTFRRRGPAIARRTRSSPTAARRSISSAAAYTLLVFGSDAAAAAPLVEAAQRARGADDGCHRIAEPQIAALYQRKFVLVRPDGHVAWRDDCMPQDAAAPCRRRARRINNL